MFSEHYTNCNKARNLKYFSFDLYCYRFYNIKMHYVWMTLIPVHIKNVEFLQNYSNVKYVHGHKNEL